MKHPVPLIATPDHPEPACCVCPICGAAARVMRSGAVRPYCLCPICGASSPAPAPSSWWLDPWWGSPAPR